MTSYFHTLPKKTRRAAWPACVVALACAAPCAHALSAPQHAQGPRLIVTLAEPAPERPYLAVVGPVPLRFAEPPPERPAEEPHRPEKPAPVEKAPEPVAPAPAPVVEPPPPPPAPPPEPPQPPLDPNAAKPLGIIPDDTVHPVKPEDVLPFFQFPSTPQGAAGSLAVPFAPAQPRAPGTLPPSSATYQQK